MEFVHEIQNVELIVGDDKVGRVAPLAQILLVARANSQRVASLDLSIRFRTAHDRHFQEVSLREAIKRENYPKGHDPEDPARAVACELKLRIWPAGNLQRPKGSSFMLRCGNYTAEGIISGSLTPFVEIKKKQLHTRRCGRR